MSEKSENSDLPFLRISLSIFLTVPSEIVPQLKASTENFYPTSQEGLRQVYDGMYKFLSVSKNGGNARRAMDYHRQSKKQILRKPHELIIILWS
jgi:hypothetical protein